MSCGRCWVQAMLLVSGIIGLAAANSGTTIAATADVHSGDLVAATVVLRGSSLEAAQSSNATSGAPALLRGSPPQHSQPSAAEPACPPGYDYEPGNGCMVPGDAYTPDYGYWPDYGHWPDYGYWPSYGLGGFGFHGQRHRFRHGFPHGISRGLAIRPGRHAANRFGHGVAHAAGFGHR